MVDNANSQTGGSPLSMNFKNKMLSWLKRDIKRPSLLTALLVFLIAALVFSQYGFDGFLRRDHGVFLYSGQQMAQGIPPYVSIFDHKGPLAPLVSGMAVSMATLLNLDDILVVRIAFFVLSSLAVAGLYLLGSKLFNSQKVGFLASFVFVGFTGFGIHAASGPLPKTAMVLFEVLSLLLTARKKWFWAGICGSLAFLAWQPAGIFALITVVLAFLQSEPGRPRVRNVLSAISGVLIPIVIVSLYFWYKGALYELVDGAILFNLRHLERFESGVTPYPLLNHLLQPILMVNIGFKSMAIPIFIGFFMVPLMYVWRLRLYRSSFLNLIRKDHFSALLLSFALVTIWSLWEFQYYYDTFVFLPYVAIGFGWLLYLALQGLFKIKEIGTTTQKLCFIVLCAILIGSAAVNYRVMANDELQEERQWAQQVESRFGTDARIVSISVPEILVLLHKTNPNPYLFICRGIDNRIDATTPGGFEGWLEELERYDPDVIAVGQVRSRFKPMLEDWLQSHYQETKVGSWTLYVKGDT